MLEKSQQRLALLIVAALVLALAGLTAAFVLRWRVLDATAGFYARNVAEGAGFGSTDWVVWEDQGSDVVVRKVHPLIRNHPDLGERYLREGDILRRIDQSDVYRAEVAQTIVRHARPGNILMYQIQRPLYDLEADPYTRDLYTTYENQNLLIPLSFQPRFSFERYTGLWSLFPWMLVLGGFLSLVTLLIILPIVRPTLRENWPVLAVAVLCLLVFLVLGLRHGNLLVRTEFVKVRFEQWFNLTVMVLLPLYGAAALNARLRGRFRWAMLLPLGVGAALAVTAYQSIFGGPFLHYSAVLEQATWALFDLQVLLLLLASLHSWQHRSRIDQAFHLLAVLYMLPLAGFHAWSMATGLGEGWTEPAAFLSSAAILFPLISVAASQLKFGRVSLVLNSSLQYVILAAVCLGLFFLIERLLATFGFQFQYQVYLELSLLIVLVFGLRALWSGYEGRFRHLFVLAQQERRDKIGAFTASIPQYSSSRRLQEDLCAALQAYFETPVVALRLREEEAAGTSFQIAEEAEHAIYLWLNTRTKHWARTRQSSADTLPEELEAALSASAAYLALPIFVNESIYGMLYLGKKRRGVYHLDDLEILGRIIQQTRLSLGVLHLLEREKLLMEKNYEANLTALRSQINPHFLFNTLNTIAALIHDDPDGAEKAVEKLAFIFRYTLKHSDKAMVSLRDELSLVRTYLEIEQIRFGDRLNLSFEIDPAGLDVELPAFVVQTIVENCIKHGIARITGRGIVSMQVRVQDGQVFVVVYDNGPGIDLSRVRSSTGLSNALTRMQQIYGREDGLVFENTGDGTRVTLCLPMG